MSVLQNARPRLYRAKPGREIVPSADHHQIRLSLEATPTIARRYHVSDKTIQSIRTGATGAYLAPDEIAAGKVRYSPFDWTYRFSEHQLLIGSARGVGLADQDSQESKDASWECQHGRLGHDLTPACGCWCEAA